MVINYLPSGGLGPYAETHAGDYGTNPSLGGGVASFSWVGIPNTSQNFDCGWVTSGGLTQPGGVDTFNEYNIAIPNRGGRISFTIATHSVGEFEHIRLGFSVGGLNWEIDQAGAGWRSRIGGVDRQWITSINNSGPPGEYLKPYPWTGSCSYLIWFPDGIGSTPDSWYHPNPPRMDFDQGSIWMTEADWGSVFQNVAPYWESGLNGTTYSGFWSGIGPPPPPDPHTAGFTVSNIFIEAWDPTQGLFVDYSRWMIARPVSPWVRQWQQADVQHADMIDGSLDWHATNADNARLGGGARGIQVLGGPPAPPHD